MLDIKSVLLNFPLCNKDNAFSMKERNKFNIEGLFPYKIENIREQTNRIWKQYQNLHSNIDRYIYLRSIKNTNEILFYYFLQSYLYDVLPIIYTPTVGEACQKFSDIPYLTSRSALFLSYTTNTKEIEKILNNISLNKKDIKVIVVTDGERILGIGDQGIGGIEISVGKLSLYTALGGIHPHYTLPIILDVGTNNTELLNNPLYLGLKKERISKEKYYEFIDTFIRIIYKIWPNVLLQFEDFAQDNALFLLNKYYKNLCCFNDDIQGTASVVLGCILATSKSMNKKIRDQIIVCVGAGSAGCGIANQLLSMMEEEGLQQEEAKKRIFMIDRYGLLTDKHIDKLNYSQRSFVKSSKDIQNWKISQSQISLEDVIYHAKPTILIGVSGIGGLFTENIIRTMYKFCNKPIIMPLSNPTSQSEAKPDDILNWTNGNALIATGSPFSPIKYKEKIHYISQCNNIYIFPSIGLGILSSGIRKITNDIFILASRILAHYSPLLYGNDSMILPDIKNIREIIRAIAIEIVKKNLNSSSNLYSEKLYNIDKISSMLIEKNFWNPKY
ncbi:NAD-dependent malic enzyme [Candidatus Schneideria nysicola]|uniref:NAD-dependent malic enzyme n=1 Tax=Candidatus Schneideria nysicola TaxID=1081631 RepID=UPI001CAA49E1|nr:NAD-dependent malic enzyme [Candidatus Schneideria nysicola]UAJ65344.1 NAD-dependent malic enzyme [Candidatus Schneideria nysicola]